MHSFYKFQQRRMSYSRHTVNEEDLGGEPQPEVNYRQQMYFKRIDRMKPGNKTRRTGNLTKDGMNGRISYAGDAGEGMEGKQYIRFIVNFWLNLKRHMQYTKTL